MYDVIVSGAGPAGSRCAEVIARAGYKVALIEKDISWRKPCGGGLYSTVFKYYPELRKKNIPKISGAVMFSADFTKVEYIDKNVKYYSSVIDRFMFDNYTRDKAVEAGAELFDKNLSIDFITKNQQKVGVITKTPSGKKEYQGNIIVIADGMSSKLATKSGIRGKWNNDQIAHATAFILEGEHNLDERCLHIFFKSFKGYWWLFPLGNNRFNVGTGTFAEDNLNYNLKDLYIEMINDPHVKEYFSHSKCKTIWSASYPMPCTGILEKSLYTDNLMIVGDAAGFCSPINGEGIQSSVDSGNAAGETAVQALEKQDYSENTLKWYKRHPRIKKITRDFKLKKSLSGFFYKNNGEKVNKMFKLAAENETYKEDILGIFQYGKAPSKEFMAELTSN